MSGPGREVRAASAIVKPKSPMRRPPSVTTSSVEAPPNGRLEPRSTTLAESHRNFDSCMRSTSTAGPKSNSWLPNVA
jgi:hypothetical protein